MFWLGRYAEAGRGHGAACCGRSTTAGATSTNSPEQHGAAAFGRAAAHPHPGSTGTAPGFTDVARPHPVSAAARRNCARCCSTRERHGTLAYAVRRLTALSGDVREQLSTDTWLVLGGLERDLQHARPRRASRDALGARTTPTALSRVLEGLLLAVRPDGREPGARRRVGRFLRHRPPPGARPHHVGRVAVRGAGRQCAGADTDSLVVESVADRGGRASSPTGGATTARARRRHRVGSAAGGSGEPPRHRLPTRPDRGNRWSASRPTTSSCAGCATCSATCAPRVRARGHPGVGRGRNPTGTGPPLRTFLDTLGADLVELAAKSGAHLLRAGPAPAGACSASASSAGRAW